MAKRTFFLVNPQAAQGRSAHWWARMMEKLRELNMDFIIEQTSGPYSAPDQVRAALAAGFRRIVAVGGDGMANEALQGFLDADGRPLYADAELAFWPSGTGRDFSRTIYSDTSDEAFVELLLHGQVMQVDVGRLLYDDALGQRKSRYFLNSFDAGLGADTCYEVEKGFAKRLWGKLAFVFGALHTLWHFRYQPLRLEFDDEVLEESFLMIFANNGRFAGGGMLLTPTASLCDGCLDMLAVRKISKPKVLRFFSSVYSGKHIQLPECVYRKLKTLKISKTKLLVETDGELPGQTPVEVSVLPAALPLLLPQKPGLDKG